MSNVDKLLEAAGDIYESGRHRGVLNVLAFLEELDTTTQNRIEVDDGYRDGVSDAASALHRSEWAAWLVLPADGLERHEEEFDFDPALLLQLVGSMHADAVREGQVEGICVVAREAEQAIETHDSEIEGWRASDQSGPPPRADYRDALVQAVVEAQKHFQVSDDEIGWE